MAKKATESRRKLVEFDAPTWYALNLLSRESMKRFQELADEASAILIAGVAVLLLATGAAAEDTAQLTCVSHNFFFNVTRYWCVAIGGYLDRRMESYRGICPTAYFNLR
jgi:hypothetical protein